MALTETAPPAIEEPGATPVAGARSAPTAVERVIAAVDHVTIGRVMIGVSLLIALASLVVLAITNLDTATLDNGVPGTGMLGESLAIRLAANAPIALLLCGVLPLLLGLAMVVVPRQVGSPAIAFPRLAGFATWTWLLATGIFVVCVVADGSYGGARTDLARLGNVAVGGLVLSLAAGAVCVAVTVLSLRPVGMGLADVPYFAFSMLVAATLWVLTFPAVLARVVLIHIQRPTPTDLAITGLDGIAWLMRQPSVYIAIIPALGIVLDSAAVTVAGRQRFRGVAQGMIGAAGLFSFGAWAQSDTARNTLIWVAFCAAAALPLLGVIGAVGDTLRRQRPRLISPIGFALVSLLLALLGAAVGLIQVIDTFGHGELVGFGTAELARGQMFLVVTSALAAGLGGVHLWGRLSFGDQLPEAPAKGLAPLVLLGGGLLALGPVVFGLLLADDATTDPAAFGAISAVGALLAALATLATLAGGLKARRDEGADPDRTFDTWEGGGTLEWAALDAWPSTVESSYPLLPAAEEA
jgi:heme/copper-type cytochrome/quinol oxidase subunit 1